LFFSLAAFGSLGCFLLSLAAFGSLGRAAVSCFAAQNGAFF
jgi:hypothetical protein